MTAADPSAPDGAGEATRRLRLLRGVTWEWRDNAPSEALERPGMGVIAQEVEAVFPELIEHGDDGVLRVEYDGLVPPLLLATGELDERVSAIEGRRRAVMGDSEDVTPVEAVRTFAGTELRTELDPDQVEKVFPQLVLTNEEGEREVAYEGLVGLLIEAVRELDSRVAALERSAD